MSRVLCADSLAQVAGKGSADDHESERERQHGVEPSAAQYIEVASPLPLQEERTLDAARKRLSSACLGAACRAA